MGACDWPVPGLTSLPRGAISLREEGWRASALGAAGAPEAAGAQSTGALSAPRDAVGAGNGRWCPGAQSGEWGRTRWEGDRGREGTGRGLSALVVGVSMSVCLSVPSGSPRARGAPGAAPAAAPAPSGQRHMGPTAWQRRWRKEARFSLWLSSCMSATEPS